MTARGPSLYAKIWRVVERIPTGKVATYGDIARAAGIPRGARVVGYALHALPAGMEIPWHRVVSSGGRISLSGPAAAEQRHLLLREGTRVNGLTVDLEAHRWKGRSHHTPLKDAG